MWRSTFLPAVTFYEVSETLEDAATFPVNVYLACDYVGIHWTRSHSEKSQRPGERGKCHDKGRM